MSSGTNTGNVIPAIRFQIKRGANGEERLIGLVGAQEFDVPRVYAEPLRQRSMLHTMELVNDILADIQEAASATALDVAAAAVKVNMAKRVRLLIYESDEAALERQRRNDGVRPGTQRRLGWSGSHDMLVTSIELDPRRITLLEVWRVLRREQSQKRSKLKEP